jgi:hypothetical protein
MELESSGRGIAAAELVASSGDGGASRDRTGDLYNAIVALSQLSYGPVSADGEDTNPFVRVSNETTRKRVVRFLACFSGDAVLRPPPEYRQAAPVPHIFFRRHRSQVSAKKCYLMRKHMIVQPTSHPVVHARRRSGHRSRRRALRRCH